MPNAVRNEFASVVLVNSPRQRRAGVAGGDGLVGGRCRHIDRARGRIQDVFGAHAADDLAAICVSCHRQSDLQSSAYVALPAVVRERIALMLKKSVPCVVVACAADIDLQASHVSTIRYIVQQRAVGAGHVDGLADPEVHVVLDLAARVARGEFDVGDDLIQRIVRIDLAEGDPREGFVLPHGCRTKRRRRPVRGNRSECW